MGKVEFTPAITLSRAQTFFRGSTMYTKPFWALPSLEGLVCIRFWVERHEVIGPKYTFLLPNLLITTTLEVIRDS